MSNSRVTVLSSAVRATTTNSSTFGNPGAIGLHLAVDVTAVPGVDTVTPKIEGYDETSGKYYDVLVGVPIAATGLTILKVYPGTVASPNVQANDVLPSTWRVTMTHSAATNFTYSIGASLIG